MLKGPEQEWLSLHSYPPIPLCYLRIAASTPLGDRWLFSEGAACLGDWTPMTECLCLGKWISPKVKGTFSIQIWYFHLLPFGSVSSEPTAEHSRTSTAGTTGLPWSSHRQQQSELQAPTSSTVLLMHSYCSIENSMLNFPKLIDKSFIQ